MLEQEIGRRIKEVRREEGLRLADLAASSGFSAGLLSKMEGGKVSSPISTLEVIAKAENHPLVFNCAIGKDRTGVLAAMLLSIIGVPDEDIIEDYTLSGPYMEELLEQIKNNPKAAENVPEVPDYFWKAVPESMEIFLTTLRKNYGSIPTYLKSMGSADGLIERLKEALLV